MLYVFIELANCRLNLAVLYVAPEHHLENMKL